MLSDLNRAPWNLATVSILLNCLPSTFPPLPPCVLLESAILTLQGGHNSVEQLLFSPSRQRWDIKRDTKRKGTFSRVLRQAPVPGSSVTFPPLTTVHPLPVSVHPVQRCLPLLSTVLSLECVGLCRVAELVLILALEEHWPEQTASRGFGKENNHFFNRVQGYGHLYMCVFL